MTDTAMTPEMRTFRDVLKDRGFLYYTRFQDIASPDELDIKLLIAALKAAEARERALRKVLSHTQWEVVNGALDNYSAGKTSDLVALGLIGQGLIILDKERKAALPALPEEPAP